MPRQARIDSPGALHHIICRGIERRVIFGNDSDRDDFVARLEAILLDTSTRCFAWTLIPNHCHILLQTGRVPVATVMRRLLTGYAVAFNRRHQRHGHLFQNRYKSILCQEEAYLLELVRYIHLNPLRAGLVASLDELARHRYSGHGCLLGEHSQPWMATDEILGRFGKNAATARKAYLAFMADGVTQGKQPKLIGGGLVRSSGGWQQVRSARESGEFLKSDERILGDSSFVDSVLGGAGEGLARKNALQQQGVDLEAIVHGVAQALGIDPGEIWLPGKQPLRVKARSLACFWAVQELGLTTSELAARMRLSQPAISLAVQRGERIAREMDWQLEDMALKNLII
jgi:REP element-mobilizing transposase RayT